jgi:dephospho-CoA kinase
MLLVGLTGGIGSGKSTVARLLAERGAVVIDADDLARQAVAPGTDGFDRVVRTFGREILTAEGDLDRRRLGEVVFADETRRRELEAIVHPEVARLFVEAVEPYRTTDRVVVYSIPLLIERGMGKAFDVVVVVVAHADRRVERVVGDRGLDPDQVRARIAAQASDYDRSRAADVLLDNDGGPGDLERQVDRLWSDLAARATAGR